MKRRPPRSTRTDTLLPYTTLFRSNRQELGAFWGPMGDAITAVSAGGETPDEARSEEHTSELQSLMRISYAVFCLKKKNSPHYHSMNSYSQTNYANMLCNFRALDCTDLHETTH